MCIKSKYLYMLMHIYTCKCIYIYIIQRIIISILTEVVAPHTSVYLPLPLTNDVVIAIISDSNFITLGQISGCKGFDIEYLLNASFNRSICLCSPWYTILNHIYVYIYIKNKIRKI